ncbi:MAG: hypothetical protein ABH870_03490 [bacterium]
MKNGKNDMNYKMRDTESNIAIIDKKGIISYKKLEHRVVDSNFQLTLSQISGIISVIWQRTPWL